MVTTREAPQPPTSNRQRVLHIAGATCAKQITATQHPKVFKADTHASSEADVGRRPESARPRTREQARRRFRVARVENDSPIQLFFPFAQEILNSPANSSL